MSFSSKKTILASGAGGESSWMTKIAYTDVYPWQAFYDSANEYIIAMGTSGNEAIQITLNAEDGEYKSANWPRIRVHDTGETMSRPKVCILSSNKYGYGMYNYNGSNEQGHLRVADDPNFGNGGQQLDVYRSAYYKGSTPAIVGDNLIWLAFDYYVSYRQITGGRYNSSLQASSKSEVWNFSTGNTMYIRDMCGDGSTQYSNITHQVNAGQGEYALCVLSVSGGYRNWSKQFRISNKSTQAAECKSITSSSDRIIACGHTEASTYSEMFVARIATNGNLNWQKSYYSGNYHFYSSSVAMDSDDNIYVCGWVQKSPNHGIIIKLSATGVFLWGLEIEASGGGAVEIIGIDVDNNGSVYFNGYTTETNRKLIIGKIPDDGSTSGTYDSVTFSSISMTTRSSPTTFETVTGSFADQSGTLEQGSGDSQIDVFTATSTTTTNL